MRTNKSQFYLNQIVWFLFLAAGRVLTGSKLYVTAIRQVTDPLTFKQESLGVLKALYGYRQSLLRWLIQLDTAKVM